eukprot:13105505-Alexandrium_andersonii.AAC.1
MSASLVGSEMCIRDSALAARALRVGPAASPKVPPPVLLGEPAGPQAVSVGEAPGEPVAPGQA